jgi:hypothetical protein
MEDLLPDVNSTLGEIVVDVMQTEIILPDREDMTFKRITGGRRVGEVDEAPHYRSGRPGAWREELPEPVIAYVRAHFHGLLREYYPDVLA